MKKILAVILAMVSFVPLIANASMIDLPTMTDEELSALSTKIDNEQRIRLDREISNMPFEELTQLATKITGEQKKRSSARMEEQLSFRYEGPGWDTPEKAVLAYLDGFKNADINKMVSAFAIETYVEHYNLIAYLEKMRSYQGFTAEIRYPNSNDFFQKANVESRRIRIVNGIIMQMSTVLLPEIDFSYPVSGDALGDIAEFINQFSVIGDSLFSQFQNYEFNKFIDPVSLSPEYGMAAIQEGINRNAGIYGADSMQSMVSLFSIDDTPYIFCCDVIRYGGKWYVSALSGNIGALLNIEVLNGGLSVIQDDWASLL